MTLSVLPQHLPVKIQEAPMGQPPFRLPLGGPGVAEVNIKGRWREALMPEAKELRVELGCGKGRFTAETARQNPDILFIAVEKVPDALVVAMERLGIRFFFFRIRIALYLRGEIFLLILP